MLDGTIADSTTGLVWQKNGNADGLKFWEGALSYCQGLSLGGESDWRLPDIKELQTIQDYTKASPSIDAVFANTQNNGYWSSSSSDLTPGNAWAAGFNECALDVDDKDVATYYVRCVRSGPAASGDVEAVLEGTPEAATTFKSAIITVSGSGVTHYRFKKGSDPYGDVTPVSQKIRLSELAKGSHTIQVLGINSAGKLQTNPTTATWTVSSGQSLVQTADGTNHDMRGDSLWADRDISFPGYQQVQYSGTVDKELLRLGHAAMGGYLGNHSAWQAVLGDPTALGCLKSGSSLDMVNGINMLAGNTTVDRVLTGMVNASCTGLTMNNAGEGYALFVRNTTELARTYRVEDLRYAKIMGGEVTLHELSTEPFGPSVTEDIHIYMRDTGANMVTTSFSGVGSLHVWVKDNGAWDAHPARSMVADPGFLASLPSSASSTGCMVNPEAGAGPELLLFLLSPLAWWLRRRGRG